MSNPFTPAGGPFAGRPGFGFGPDTQRRTLHGARRRARREFFEHLREHAPDHDGPRASVPVLALDSGPGSARVSDRSARDSASGRAAGAADGAAAAPGAASAGTSARPSWRC